MKRLFGISTYIGKHKKEEHSWIVRKLEDVDMVLELLVNYISNLVSNILREKKEEVKKI